MVGFRCVCSILNCRTVWGSFLRRWTTYICYRLRILCYILAFFSYQDGLSDVAPSRLAGELGAMENWPFFCWHRCMHRRQVIECYVFASISELLNSCGPGLGYPTVQVQIYVDEGENNSLPLCLGPCDMCLRFHVLCYHAHTSRPGPCMHRLGVGGLSKPPQPTGRRMRYQYAEFKQLAQWRKRKTIRRYS